MYSLTASGDAPVAASTGIREARNEGSSDAPKSAGKDLGGIVWARARRDWQVQLKKRVEGRNKG
jgi:hypothetical protein